MTHIPDLSSPVPSPAPPPVVGVNRAVAELRRGSLVLVTAAKGAPLVVLAAEGVESDTLEQLAHLSACPPDVALTARRATVLGLPATDGDLAVRLRPARPWRAEDIAWLVNPCADLSGGCDPASLTRVATTEATTAAVRLAKLARLLPAAVVAEASPAALTDTPLLAVSAEDIALYQQTAARTLRLVSQAPVPLVDAENARIVAFRPADGGIEHLAIVIGQPDLGTPVLTRLHSECFTGDLLGSLRCDCGDQLRGAIREIAQTGSGILLYLAQEGRGIGLVNKLRAYQLQDAGFDTLDANLQLGFDDDERIYLPAAQMLRLLGVERIRLLTNNPAKVEALARHGVTVAERVPHIFPSNGHNAFYLRTKATRSGHLF